MSTSDVVNLDDYRAYRDARVRLVLALYQPDNRRRLLALRLWEALELVQADRGAVVWIDEYGPGLIHTHCILDLASDEPRRSFSPEPLRQAWESGIPGFLDEPDLTRTGDRILPEGPRSLCAVALGSDGTKAWFLVVDSRATRRRLEGRELDSLLFLAGECASLVIHPAADAEDPGRETIGLAGPTDVPRTRFPGWSVLQDREEGGGENLDEAEITLRFLVVRLVRGWMEDDFASDAESLSYQVEAVRREMDRHGLTEKGGRGTWERVLEGMETGDLPSVAAGLSGAALRAEREGQLHGARELDRLSYGAAAAACVPEEAVTAARLAGRVTRRMGLWDESQEWYAVAGGVARAAGLRRSEALALDGLGNTYRDRGRLSGARETYLEVLAIGEDLDDRDLQGRAHQNLALVEKHAERTDDALEHAWAAVNAYQTPLSFFRALADLGDLFVRCGELRSADRVLTVVADACSDADTRVPALELLGHVAALRGDRRGFAERTGEVRFDAMNVAVQAEMMFCRGKSHLALGERDVAREWIRRSLDFAEAHRVSRVTIQAAKALDRLERGEDASLLGNEIPEPGERTMSGFEEPLGSLGSAIAGLAG